MSTQEELEYAEHIAEYTAVIAMHLADKHIRLGGEGLIAHYRAIVSLAFAVDSVYPLDFDWATHVDADGDCWDMETCSWVDAWLGANQDEWDFWEDPDTYQEPIAQPPVKNRQDIDLTLPE